MRRGISALFEHAHTIVRLSTALLCVIIVFFHYAHILFALVPFALCFTI